MWWWLFRRTPRSMWVTGVPPAVVRPAKVALSSLPSPSHPLLMHNSISRVTDFSRHCRSPVLTSLQRMYNTVGGNARPVGETLAPYGSLRALGVRNVVRRLAYPSLLPVPRVCYSLTSLGAPLVPVQVSCAVLAGPCRLLGPLGRKVTKKSKQPFEGGKPCWTVKYRGSDWPERHDVTAFLHDINKDSLDWNQQHHIIVSTDSLREMELWLDQLICCPVAQPGGVYKLSCLPSSLGLNQGDPPPPDIRLDVPAAPQPVSGLQWAVSQVASMVGFPLSFLPSEVSLDLQV